MSKKYIRNTAYVEAWDGAGNEISINITYVFYLIQGIQGLKHHKVKIFYFWDTVN